MYIKDAISEETQFYHLPEPFLLESGITLPKVQVAYRTWGSLNDARDNVVLVCHPLTGSADADEWWGPLFGVGQTLDPTRDFIVCTNILGSCNGTTGPTAPNPETGRPYGPEFPRVTVRDMVSLQVKLLDSMGIDVLRMAIGGSLGGMQVLELASLFPERVQTLVSLAASGRHSPWCIGISESQRQAIYADAHWNDGYYTAEAPPAKGLAAARSMAMCMYRTWESFEKRFGRDVQGEEGSRFAIASYLQYQGESLVRRFDANSYITLTHAMDSHDLSRGRGEYEQAIAAIEHPTLIVSIPSDVLYWPEEQKILARYLPNAVFRELPSIHGHDGFLIDMDPINTMVADAQEHWASDIPRPSNLAYL